MFHKIDIKRVLMYSTFGVTVAAISIVAATFLSEKSHEETTVGEVQISKTSPKCEEHASMLSNRHSKVNCYKGFIETQELENGRILVICKCDTEEEFQQKCKELEKSSP